MNEIPRASGSGSRGRRSTNVTEADLLGVGPSRKLGKSTVTTSTPQILASRERTRQDATTNGLERSRSRRSWRVFLQSLSKEELAVIETNFDAMSDEQLQTYITAFESIPTPPPGDLSDADGISPLAAPEIPADPPPYAPEEIDVGARLFPPSPPGKTRQELVDHPIRILSRAVRELREVVETLEEENEELRLLKQAGGVSSKRRDRQADQVGLTALIGQIAFGVADATVGVDS